MEYTGEKQSGEIYGSDSYTQGISHNNVREVSSTTPIMRTLSADFRLGGRTMETI